MKTKSLLNFSSTGVYLFTCLFLLFMGCNQQSLKDISDNKEIGEFSYRMLMAKERLTTSKYKPEFTDEFILADVNINLENPRRFYNYSGDISGRYIEVLSPFCRQGNCEHLDSLVKDVMKYQHSDGRFGDPSLVFSEELIGKDHMPLLWGNGRLLVGLLEYYKQTSDKEVLASARRLGDFFINSYGEVTTEVSKRLEGLGADGIICFTQYVEPLVKLSGVTGDSIYAHVAAKVYPMLPSRGILHSHGYLTTLRGVLDLYEYDKNLNHFEYVENAYNDLVNSDDYTLYGSVREYFGNRGERDEGCSTADFVRLSLHLYKLTNDLSYLDRAEFGIYNALYFNQFFTGDYGHHTFDKVSSYSNTYNAAWWCCTMSGLRVMQIIRNGYFVENTQGQIKLNIYLDTDYSDQNISLSVKRGKMYNDFHSYDIGIDNVKDITRPLLLRKPSWAGDIEIFLNNEKIDCSFVNGYYSIGNKLKDGDSIQIRLKYLTRIITQDKKSILLSEIDQQVSGVLCYGPYLMCVDNNLDYTFLAEPNNNIIYSNTIDTTSGNEVPDNIASESFVEDAYLVASYKHGGFPSYYQTTFRPVSEMTFNRHPYMMVIMNFIPEASVKEKSVDKSMVVPAMEQ